MLEGLALARPWVLAALALLPAYAFLRLRLLRRDVVPYAPLQYRPGPAGGRLASRLLLPVELLLLAILLLGLAGPFQRDRLELLEDEGIDVALVLDVSLSMLAEDMPPNRLEALRRIARDFLHRSGSHRIGMVIFAKDAFVQSPLSTDHAVLSSLLEGVTVHTIDQARSGGTAIGDALLVTAELLHGARIEGRDQALILITDGESNLGAEPLLAARYLRRLGIRLYALGVGGEVPMPVVFEGQRIDFQADLDEEGLQALASVAGGRYFRATDEGSLEEIFGLLSRLESAPLEVRRLEIRRPRTALTALAALVLFAATLVLQGVVRRRPLR